MKNVLLFGALVSALCFSSTAYPWPTSNNYDAGISSDSPANSRTFTSTVLCNNALESWYTGSCPSPGACYKYTIRGKNTGFNQVCCRYVDTCSAAGEPLSEEEIVQSEQESLSDVFTPQTTTTTSYWGYYQSSARSPNAGRLKLTEAKLDVCIGDVDVDTAKTMGVSWCMNTACGAAKNEHCNNTGYNDGSSTSAAVCKDRCQCALESGTCEYL